MRRVGQSSFFFATARPRRSSEVVRRRHSHVGRDSSSTGERSRAHDAHLASLVALSTRQHSPGCLDQPDRSERERRDVDGRWTFVCQRGPHLSTYRETSDHSMATHGEAKPQATAAAAAGMGDHRTASPGLSSNSTSPAGYLQQYAQQQQQQQPGTSSSARSTPTPASAGTSNGVHLPPISSFAPPAERVPSSSSTASGPSASASGSQQWHHTQPHHHQQQQQHSLAQRYERSPAYGSPAPTTPSTTYQPSPGPAHHLPVSQQQQQQRSLASGDASMPPSTSRSGSAAANICTKCGTTVTP